MGQLFHKLLVRVSPYLDRKVAAKQYTTYQELAVDMGGYANRSIYVADALGTTLIEDQEQGVPHRAASVVRGPRSKGAGLPGSGYFWVCRKLGIVQNLDDHEALKAHWKRQIEALGLKVPENLASMSFAFHKGLEAVFQKHHPDLKGI